MSLVYKMAEGEESIDSYSIYSDVYYDYSCAPCSKGNKNIEAVKFCVECSRLFCSKCLNDHNKFDFMTGHQILDKTASTGRRGKDRPDIPTVRCTEHDGKILDMFCKTHDVPCCSVCDSVYHSQCSDKDYLPNVAKANMKPEEWQRMRTSASVVKERLEQSKVKRQENLESISNQMSVILSKIREKRDAINQRLDAAEDDIKGKLDSKFIEFSGALTKEIERLDEFIKIIDGYEDGKTENKSDNYIMLKQMKQKLADENRFAASLSPPNNSIDYIETSDMAEIIGVVDKFSFGYISGNGGVETVTEEADINIKSTGDTTVSCICDSCLMESGEVILTDQNNRNIKKLDCSFHLKVSLALPGKPCAVCPTDGSEIAVSLLNTKTIHFVSTGSPMFLLSNKIKIGESCRGIAYNEGKLYLSCGGMTKYHDGPGQIRVYEKSGQFLRKVDNVVKIPKRMTICKDKHPADIYIADEENGVLCLDTSVPSDSITSAFDYQQLVGAVGVCYLGRGQIAVCGYDSHNVLLVSKSGNLIKELRSRNHGIVKPKTICLDHTGHKMLVGLTDNDHIKVINLIRS